MYHVGGDELDGAGLAAEASAPCAVCGCQTVLCCSGCEAVFYCSADCQHRDWRSHRRVCVRQPPVQSSAPESPAAPSKVAASATIQTDAVSCFSAGSPAQDPQEMFAEHAAMVTTRERRLQLRASAVLAAREDRHKDAMLYAAEAYELAQTILRMEGDIGTGTPEAESATLVEVLLLCRAACVEGNSSVGMSFLRKLLDMTDKLAGTGGKAAIFEPCTAASLLMTTAELCFLFEQQENAEDYAQAFLAMARVAHGEGSAAVGDAHALILGMLTNWGRHEEALLHANMLLQIRQRAAKKGADKVVGDAYWNLGLLKYQVGQHEGALEALKLSREISFRIVGESVRTSDIDVALGNIYRTMGQYKHAVLSFRSAIRARQRCYGFAHAETRRVAALLDATEVQMKGERDLGVEVSSARGVLDFDFDGSPSF